MGKNYKMDTPLNPHYNSMIMNKGQNFIFQLDSLNVTPSFTYSKCYIYMLWGGTAPSKNTKWNLKNSPEFVVFKDISPILVSVVHTWLLLEMALDVEQDDGWHSWEGHGTRSGQHGIGAGWAMNLGISSPGIRTETPLEYTLICNNLNETKWFHEALTHEVYQEIIDIKMNQTHKCGPS